MSLFRPVGLGATGFNQGIGGWVDLVNEGLKSVGLPMNDEPFMGTAFVNKYLGGAQYMPQNDLEAILQRSGKEVGANAPLLGASLYARGNEIARQAVDASKSLATDSNMQALKNLPSAIVQELARVDPAKLAAVESAMAASGGAFAQVAKSVFPEGGKLSEFIGELAGAFTPSVLLGMIGKAKQAATGGISRILGMESEEETKRRIGKTLRDAATPEQIQQGVDTADKLRNTITPGAEKGEGFELSAGSSIKGGAVSSTEKAEAKSSIKIGAKLKDQRDRNVQAVKEYFDATAPEGDAIKLVEGLQKKRSSDEALLQIGLNRTETKLAAVRGELSKRQAAFQADLESRMQAADNLLDARLQVIGPQLRPQQRQDVIRQAYDEEVAKFRASSRSDYQELDNLGHAELPVDRTLSKLAMLQETFPAQLQAIKKINPRLAQVIDNLGHDYEMQQRAVKAQADLEAVGGSSKDQRGGFRIPVETQGKGGTNDTVGVPSNYPTWYKSLANRKVAGTDNILDRETIERALESIRTGQPSGLHDKTVEHVAQALRGDVEFRKSPYFEPVMDELLNTPSASLTALRQVRSDALALGRQARASGDRAQGYVLNELVNGLDQDIDRLMPGSSAYANLYPNHGNLYRQVSADYREGVETLFKGQTGKLYQVRNDGSYRVDEGSVPALFWKDESSLDQFTKAFGSHADARLALRDFALDDLYRSTVKPLGGGKWQIDEKALDRWVRDNGPKLKAFPELEPMFRDTVKLQNNFDALSKQAAFYQNAKSGQDRITQTLLESYQPGDFHPSQVDAAESRLLKVQDVIDRTRTGWEMSKASLFIRQPVTHAANAIVTAKNPIAAYEEVAKKIQRDPEAMAGLNKAIWVSISESLEPKLRGVAGQVNLGQWHKALESLITTKGDLMKRVLGAEGFTRMKTTADAIEHIALGSKAGSDTSVNLQVHAALASTWLSRAWAVTTGRVPAGFGFAERAVQGIIKALEKHTAVQQEEILLQAFYDPKVFQTLVIAAQHGGNTRMVQQQIIQHLHALNLSEQMEGNNK